MSPVLMYEVKKWTSGMKDRSKIQAIKTKVLRMIDGKQKE